MFGVIFQGGWKRIFNAYQWWGVVALGMSEGDGVEEGVVGAAAGNLIGMSERVEGVCGAYWWWM